MPYTLKSIANIAGIFLIVIGVLGLIYEGYTYTKHETVAQIGDLKVTADTKETVYISPIYGGVSLVAGVILVVISRRMSN
ncbi:MAG TPA: DUF3185 domain-containing protein [Gammaproteobacteria bacterium]|jgi:hypothetical protein|nr:DUF3185 domain-containing protein [Gammaproteobacteria bacterium]